MAGEKKCRPITLSGREVEAEPHFRENRRLTDLSVQVLTLQRASYSDQTQELARLRELAQLYDAIGQSQSAKQLRALVSQRQQNALP
ncbi:MAG: hypothetical protein B7Z44_07940 [Caulobacter sp. 12-67-6]|nr:MAG: hypothetical protein B7Z44_07940 [Caulobacter sp. 12-67-6]